MRKVVEIDYFPLRGKNSSHLSTSRFLGLLYLSTKGTFYFRVLLRAQALVSMIGTQ